MIAQPLFFFVCESSEFIEDSFDILDLLKGTSVDVRIAAANMSNSDLKVVYYGSYRRGVILYRLLFLELKIHLVSSELKKGVDDYAGDYIVQPCRVQMNILFKSMI